MCKSRSSAWIAMSFMTALLGTLPARAQCLEWKPGFNLPGIGGAPRAWATFDDGTGPALYVAGIFHDAGDVAAENVARWDGTKWSAVGTGMNGPVAALAVFDDGKGAALYAGGSFQGAGGVNCSGMAKWNGSAWSAVDSSIFFPWPDVQALVVHDDGSGSALYAAGNFNVSGIPGISGMARWNGSTWAPVGSGFETSGIQIHGMTVFDDGSGPALYLGGTFDRIDGVFVHGLAKWDGSSWIGLGDALDGPVGALATYDDGSGSALYVGGSFTAVEGAVAGGFARWNGSSWTPLGADLLPPWGNPDVRAIRGFDDGRGPAVYVGGWIGSAGGTTTYGIARWKNGSWSGLAGGLDDSHLNTYPRPGVPRAFGVFDEGSGPALFVGGTFDSAGGITANNVARWSGAGWSSVGSGDGILGRAETLALLDDGSGAALYATTVRTIPGGSVEAHLVRWNGTSWSPVGTGTDDGGVHAMTVHDDGSGGSLYVGGSFTSLGGVGVRRIARWDGQTWHPLGAGMEKPNDTYVDVSALRSFDDGSGPALYAGGYFTIAGGVPANFIARWDGTSWSPLGNGLDGAVLTLEVFDDGTGPALYAGGYFNFTGDVRVSHIAKWNGSTWSDVGGGIPGAPWGAPGDVNALAVVDLGSGPALYAGGNFLYAGDVLATRVARWNGTNWSGLGAGLPSAVFALTGYDDGWGPAIYAGGSKWNGSTWNPTGGGITVEIPGIQTMAVGDLDGNGVKELYFGGGIVRAGALASHGIAEWIGCVPHGTPVCLGDGNGAPCPCSNSGWPGSGCNNAVQNGGARLNGRGAPSLAADTLFLDCTNVRPNVLCLAFQGDQRIAPVFDGDGLRCAAGHVKRLFAHTAYGSSFTVPDFGDPTLSARSAALGDPLSAGARRIYQVYYRDKSPTFCPNPPGNTWNLSSGLMIDWLP